MHRKTVLHIAFSALLLALAPAALHAVCPAGQFYLDLQNCTTANMAGVTFMAGGNCTNAVATTSCPAVAGWKQAAIKIVVPAGCSQANVVVEYEGLPCGWTVNDASVVLQSQGTASLESPAKASTKFKLGNAGTFTVTCAIGAVSTTVSLHR